MSTGIRQSELIQVPIIVPPMNIQKQFAASCNPIMIILSKKICMKSDSFSSCKKWTFVITVKPLNYHLTEVVCMTTAEIIQIVIGILSLVATIAVSVFDILVTNTTRKRNSKATR